MKIDRQDLNERLLRHLLDPEFHKNYLENMKKMKSLIESHVSMAVVQGIVNQTMSIRLLRDFEIYHLVKALYSILENSSLNPEKFFTEEEIKNYSEVTIEKKKQKDTLVYVWFSIVLYFETDKIIENHT